MIRNVFRLFFCIMTAFCCVTACKEESWEDTFDVIVTSEDEVAFSHGGGEATISVGSVSDWTASVSTPDWLSAEKSGGSVVIKATANTGSEVRIGCVTLQSPTSTKEINVFQAYMEGSTILSVLAPETLNFDSEGETFEFTVNSNKPVKAVSDAEWLKVEMTGGLVSVTAIANEGAHRAAKVSISCEGAETVVITAEQISREENPYLRMLGYFGLSATSWVMNGQIVNAPGIGSYCTIEQGEYRKSFIIKDLFMQGTEIEATYDERNEEMTINLGVLCLTRQSVQNETWYFYFTKINPENRSFNSGIATAKLGKAIDPESNTEVSAIVFDELDSEFPYLGLVGMTGLQYAMLGDVPYAGGNISLISRTKPATE